MVLPTLWSLFFSSGGFPSLYYVSLTISVLYFTRGGMCTLGDIVDKNIDQTVGMSSDRYYDTSSYPSF